MRVFVYPGEYNNWYMRYYYGMDNAQKKRIRDELKAVGVGSIGLRTPESKELVRMLHPDEHIGGVVYGRYADSLGWLVATNLRVIFMDKKPLFVTTDELTYDVVSGVKRSHAGLFTSVVLHTRLGDYTIRYVNAKCAHTFVQYIEKKRLENVVADKAKSPFGDAEKSLVSFQKNNSTGANFLKSHGLAVLSTVDRTGNVHGTVIYYVVDPNNLVYILTKSGTGKGRNVYAHSQVALTVYESGTMQTVQLQGIAEVETEQATKDRVFSQIVAPRPYGDEIQLPPTARLYEGAYTIIKIKPTLIIFHDYTKSK